jgi:hypothetical protein
MTLRCVERPNRSQPRPFTVEKLARLLCALSKAQGEQVKEAFDAKFKEVCPPEEQRRPKAAEESALEVAAQALEANNAFLSADAMALQRFLSFFVAVSIAFRYVGRWVGVPGKLASIGVVAVEKLAEERLASVLVQKAANDAALEIVRRAAANEARFLIRAGAR